MFAELVGELLQPFINVNEYSMQLLIIIYFYGLYDTLSLMCEVDGRKNVNDYLTQLFIDRLCPHIVECNKFEV